MIKCKTVKYNHIVVIEEEIMGSVIKIKKSEKKNYHSYGREDQLQDLIKSVGSNGVSNEQYETYCELKSWLKPNRKSRK